MVCIFLLSAGVTYAYFTASGTQSGNGINAEAGTLSLNYTDHDKNIVLTEAYPGDSVSKTFTVENTGTLEANFDVVWSYLVNTIINNELYITLECLNSEDESCGYTRDIAGTTINMPIMQNISIPSGETYTFNVTIEFIETNMPQDYNQGQQFGGVINIVDATNAARTVVYGRLLDENEDPIANAIIETHSEPITTTDANGYYTIEGIEFG